MEPRWKLPYSYNDGVYITKGWCFILLVTLWLPSWLFDFLWIFNLHESLHSMCVLWTSTLQYILNTIYMFQNSDVAYDHSWNDRKWHYWHGFLDAVAISRNCCCWVMDIFLNMLFFSAPHGLVIRNLCICVVQGLREWSWVWGCEVSSLSPTGRHNYAILEVKAGAWAQKIRSEEILMGRN